MVKMKRNIKDIFFLLLINLKDTWLSKAKRVEKFCELIAYVKVKYMTIIAHRWDDEIVDGSILF